MILILTTQNGSVHVPPITREGPFYDFVLVYALTQLLTLLTQVPHVSDHKLSRWLSVPIIWTIMVSVDTLLQLTHTCWCQVQGVVWSVLQNRFSLKAEVLLGLSCCIGISWWKNSTLWKEYNSASRFHKSFIAKLKLHERERNQFTFLRGFLRFGLSPRLP